SERPDGFQVFGGQNLQGHGCSVIGNESGVGRAAVCGRECGQLSCRPSVLPVDFNPRRSAVMAWSSHLLLRLAWAAALGHARSTPPPLRRSLSISPIAASAVRRVFSVCWFTFGSPGCWLGWKRKRRRRPRSPAPPRGVVRGEPQAVREAQGLLSLAAR